MVSASRPLLAPVATLLLAAADTSTARAASVRGRLTSEFGGPNMCLDTVNGGPDNDQAPGEGTQAGTGGARASAELILMWRYRARTPVASCSLIFLSSLLSEGASDQIILYLHGGSCGANTRNTPRPWPGWPWPPARW
jgi:hypothetical protein